jgi:hypothetical protein
VIPESVAVLLLVAAAGGAFGASIGALPAFALTGVAVIAGEVLALAGGPTTITSTVAFGPVLGPHVAFGGGAAAAAYTARKEPSFAPGFDYHPAKEITRGLGTRPDVLGVGAAFGVVGGAATAGLRAVAAPVDPVAAGVVLSAFAHRVALGYHPVGTPVDGWFDMSPFERGDRVAADGAGAADRPAVEPWLPHQYRWRDVTAIGLSGGALGGYVAHVTGSPFLAFGVSAASLGFLAAGVTEVPVTHHVTLPASTAVVALAGAGARAPGSGGPSALVAVGVGAAFGWLGAVVGEGLQRLLYAHADTHLDPPAASIVVTSLTVAVLAATGVLPDSTWVPLP